MPATAYITNVLAGLTMASAQIVRLITVTNQKTLADLLAVTPAAFNNKVMGRRPFIIEELLALAREFKLEKPARQVQAYIDLRTSLYPRLASLPIVPKTVAARADIPYYDFNRRLHDAHLWKRGEIEAINRSLISVHHQLAAFVNIQKGEDHANADSGRSLFVTRLLELPVLRSEISRQAGMAPAHLHRRLRTPQKLTPAEINAIIGAIDAMTRQLAGFIYRPISTHSQPTDVA